MALILSDRVRETTTTTGTGAFSLGGAATGYRAFSSVMANADITYYTCAGQGTSEWEVGIGTWNTGNTLTRTTILASSNGGSAVTFSAGTKDIFITYTATKVVIQDASGNVGIGGAPTYKLDVFNGDAQIYGVRVGRGAGAVASNTAVGASALAANTTGAYGTALGGFALASNTTASFNTAVGNSALYANTTGAENTAVGVNALDSNTIGSYNTAVGLGALQANTTASQHTAIGYQAGYYTNGIPVTLVGYRAGYNNTYGTAGGGPLVAVGYLANYSYTATTGDAYGTTTVGSYAGYSTSTGTNNTTVGGFALYTNTTGSSNTAIGAGALYLSTTGSDNSALGFFALYSNTSGASNTALGRQALYSNTTASNNTAVGYQAGYSNTVGAENVLVGIQAGYTNTNSSYNTFVGRLAGNAHNLGAAGNGLNTFIGAASGSAITTGTKNTIIGTYGGNQGGLDIRTASNYIVLSDGDGNPRAYWNGANATFGGTLAATIYYDSNDTNYYVNGNAGTALKYLQVNGDWGSSPFGSGSETFTIRSTYASMAQRQTNGSLGYWLHHVDSAGRYHLYGGAGSTDGNSWDWVYRAFPNGSGTYAEFQFSARAPIFYDSNNTAYYGDFASTSILNILNLPSGSAAINTTTPGTGTYQLNFTGQGTSDYAQAITWGWSSSGAQAGIYVQSSGSYGTRMYFATTDSFAVGSKTAMSIDPTGIVTTTRNYLQAANSVRAPIFYDSDNTAYYMDFNAGGQILGNFEFASNNNASTSYSVAAIELRESNYGSSTYLPPRLGFHWGGVVASQISIESTGRIKVIDNPGSGYEALIGSILYGSASVRAPIFYDSDNTGYYTDQASTSNYNVLAVQRAYAGYDAGITGSFSCNNWFRSSGDTGWFNVSYSGGIYMADSTWVRVYNSKNFLVNGGYGQSDSSWRAPIFYDSDNTSYYGDFAGVSQLSGLDVYGGGLYDDQTGFRLPLPGNAAYATSASSVTGAIKVRIPTAALGSNTMCAFTVSVYTYDGLSFDIRCGGYNYSDASKTWYNVFAYMTSASRGALNVRFGWDGTSQCIWIGELATSWTYPQVSVRDFMGGYSGYTGSNWRTGWNVSFEASSFYSVSQTQVVYPLPYTSNNTGDIYTPRLYDSNNTAYYVDPASTSLVNTIRAAGTYTRNAAATGYLDGGYASYETASTTGPIYCIGTSYAPGSTSIGSMYGIGYAYQFSGGMTSNVWGLYVAAGGTIGVFLDGGSGITYSLNSSRAPIFYDRNDTNYYCDPTGRSVFSGANNTALTAGSTNAISLVFNSPIIGFNTYYNSGWQRQTSGSYCANIEMEPSTGTIGFNTSSGTTGTPSFTNRVRITNGGLFQVNTTGGVYGNHAIGAIQASNYILTLVSPYTTGSQNYGIDINYSGAPNGTGNDFLWCGDSAAIRAEIRSNGGLANYSANDVNLSDRREKTNFAPAKAYLDTICAIPVQTFNYVDQNMEEDPGETLGVVAQDVQAVAPELVMESNWGTKDNPKMRLSIYQTDLQYALMKCIQELNAKVAALESKLANQGA